MGKGSPSMPTDSTVTQTNIPEYARPYVESTLGQAAALTDINKNPFQPYGGQRLATFSPMEAQAFQNTAGQQTAGQITDASNIASRVGQAGLGTQQTAAGLQQTALGYGGAGAGYGAAASQYGAAGAQQAQRASQLAQAQALGYGAQGAQFGASGADLAAQAQRAAEGQADLYGQMGAGFGTSAAGLAPEAQMYGAQGAQFGAQGAGIGGIGVQQAQQGFGAGAQYAQQATSPEAMRAYMSPYMQNVVDVQSQEARRQSEIEQQGIQSQAAQQGAFGGSRSAILEAERQRNLGTQLGRIQAEGSQRGFEQAQQAQQFGAGLGIQGLQAGYQGLQAGLQGTGQGIQGAQAGLAGLGQAGDLFGKGMQGAGLGLQGTGQRLAAGQLGLAGTAQGIQGAEAGLRGVGHRLSGGQLGLSGAQTGIQGQQAGITGAQAGLQGVGQATSAGQYGIAGLGAAGQAAGTLGQLGQTQFGQETQITRDMANAGAAQRGLQQQALDVDYQNYLTQQQYPYQQLAFMQGMYSGLPLSQQTQASYSTPAPMGQQALGLGLGALGAYKAFS
jgi:hypothetical protein